MSSEADLFGLSVRVRVDSSVDQVSLVLRDRSFLIVLQGTHFDAHSCLFVLNVNFILTRFNIDDLTCSQNTYKSLPSILY